MRRFLLLLLIGVTSNQATATEKIDAFLRRFIAQNQVPGAAVAISREGKLLYARGFGWADQESKTRVKPTSLFRIASISKPITAVAILRLSERGRIALDDPMVKHLKQMESYRSHPDFDQRIEKVTIQDLLRHSGGWDRDESFDPMGLQGHLRIAKELKLKPPIKPRDYITFMFRRPLQFDPGTRYAYSNFGYLLLGRIIEDVSGEPYESHVKQHLLAPPGHQDHANRTHGKGTSRAG